MKIKIKGKELKKEMAKRGLNNKDFADMLGVTRQYISQALKQKTGISSKIVKRIIEAFDIDFDEIFEVE